MYSKKVIDHFRNPHNFGKMKNPDGVGKVGNVVCGDIMWLYIKVKSKNGQQVLEDVKFETFGCVSAIASSSMITDLAKGKTLSEGLKINKDTVVKALGELPVIKIHCSVLAADALAEAIYDYLKKKKEKVSEELQKRHQRIGKEKEIVKEKYKGWVND